MVDVTKKITARVLGQVVQCWVKFKVKLTQGLCEISNQIGELTSQSFRLKFDD